MKRIACVVAAVVMAGCNESEKKQEPAPPASAPEISVTTSSTEALNAFKKGRDLFEDARDDEAAVQFQRAVDVDPKFALAHAYLARVTPSAEATHHIDEAVKLEAGLPEAEKLVVEWIAAQQRGDEKKVDELRHKMAEVAPTDWRAQYQLGVESFDERKWADAEKYLRKATELAPTAGPPYNALGYTYLEENKTDDAINALKKYVELRPWEANPYDSLGEALLVGGKFDESEKNFRRANDISPRFWAAMTGVALTRFFRHDWAGGRDALGQARQQALRPFDKLEVDRLLAWSYLAEGKAADAMKTVDAIQAQAEAQKIDWWTAFPSLLRASFLTEDGKLAESLKQLDQANERATKMALPGVSMNDLRRGELALRVWDEAKLGKTADAEKTLARITDEAKKAPDNVQLQSMTHFGAGAVALAKNDVKGAIDHFGKCSDSDSLCRYQLVLTQEKSGDKAGAQANRDRLLKTYQRDPQYLYVWARLSGGATATNAQVAPPAAVPAPAK